MAIVLSKAVLLQLLEDGLFLGVGIAVERVLEGVVDSLLKGVSAFGDDLMGKDTGGFDKGGVIEQHQGGIGCIGARPFCGAFFPAGSIEGLHHRV